MRVSIGSWAFTYGPHADHPLSFPETVEHLSRGSGSDIDHRDDKVENGGVLG